MAFGKKTGPETQALRDTVSQLPRDPATWTTEQRQQFTTQSDRAMREQNSTSQPGQLT